MPRLSVAAEDFIKTGLYLRNWSAGTIRTYRQGLRALQAAIGDEEVNTLTKPLLQSFIIVLKDRGLKPAGCNMYVRTVNSFLSWLNEEGSLPDRLRLPLVPEPDRGIDTLDDTDARAITSFRPKTLTELRLFALVCLLLDTGCRINEAIGLQEADVDFDNMVLSVDGKGSKRRIVPFSYELRKILFRYLQAKKKGDRKSPYVFCTRSGRRLGYRNAYRDIVSFCGRLGVKAANPHKFRHSYATNFLRSGGDPFRLQRILGHSQIQTTLRYVHLVTDDLKEAHQRTSVLNRLR